MTPLQMIAEWRKGCSCALPTHPEKCESCTRALIDTLERKIRETDEAHRKEIESLRRSYEQANTYDWRNGR